MSRFFEEDLVAFKCDPSLLGIIARSWRDLDQEPSETYTWYFHEDVPRDVESVLLREGRLLQGYVMIEFPNFADEFCLVNEKALRLVDRSLAVGDLVKRSISDIQSGTVISTSMRCKIQPCCSLSLFHNDLGNMRVSRQANLSLTPACGDSCSIDSDLEVWASELKDHGDYREEDFIAYKDWIGQIMTTVAEITIRLTNGSVVTVDDPQDVYEPTFYEGSMSARYVQHLARARYHWDDENGSKSRLYNNPLSGSCYPGQIVQTKKANLRKGRWRFGAYSPNIPPFGMVLESRTVEIDVEWLYPNILKERVSHAAPSAILTTDDINSGHIRVYDRSKLPSKPLSLQLANASYSPDIGLGSFVRFNGSDIAGESYKEIAEIGLYQIPRVQTQGFDMNVFRVTHTKTNVMVQWQDGSISEEAATSLDHYENSDDHDVWPGDKVSFQPDEKRQVDGSSELIITSKVGVVQSVDAESRIAQVHWYEKPNVTLEAQHAFSPEPMSEFGTMSENMSDVSLYEIYAHPGLSVCRGNMVFVLPETRQLNLQDVKSVLSRDTDNLSQRLPTFNRITFPPLLSEDDNLGLDNSQLGTFDYAVSRALHSQLGSASVQNHKERERTGALNKDVSRFETTYCLGEVTDLCSNGEILVRLGLTPDALEIRAHPDLVVLVAEGDTADDASDSSEDSEEWTESDTESVAGLQTQPDETSSNSSDCMIVGTSGESNQQSETSEQLSDREDGAALSVSPAIMSIDVRSSNNEPDISLNDSSFGVPVLEHQKSVPALFEVLDGAPPQDHYFADKVAELDPSLLRRIAREHTILKTSLPDGVYVRSWEARLDLLRVLISGPVSTPYEHAPFVFDMYLGSDFPISPPKTFFYSWTSSNVRINPNLYENGTVCLSLLGTWNSERDNEAWSPRSTTLQIIVSILGLVLVREPYYNEAGYEALVNTPDSRLPSALYNEKAYVMSKNFVKVALMTPPSGLEAVVQWLYVDIEGPELLRRIIDDCQRLETNSTSRAATETGNMISHPEEEWARDRLSTGALIPLKSSLKWLVEFYEAHASTDDDCRGLVYRNTATPSPVRTYQSHFPRDPDLHHPAPYNPEQEPSVPAPSTETTTAVPTLEDSSASGVEGTWGERDVGGPVSHRVAMEDYEEMRRELSNLSPKKSKASFKSEKKSMHRAKTSQSAKSVPPAPTSPISSVATGEKDLEAGDADLAAAKEMGFELGPFIQEGHFERRNTRGESTKKVGVIFKDLTVKGLGQTRVYAKTLPDAIIGTFGPDLYRLVCRFIPALNFNKNPQLRTLTNDFTGVVRDGEMMLVLGRPGSGCTTFLKAIANKREEFISVTGDVSYGGISAKEQNAHYRGEVNYNAEDDLHLPTLNVWQTLLFSLLNKTKKRERGEVNIIVDALMKMFGISHTAKTLVGNEMVRGISGGERKRVSIAETLATKSTVVCWDNSTRGLDASTALDYANSLRIMTDVSNRTTLVTLYQAGEQIYELMDKVLVIDEGRMLYQGPASKAKQYFVDLGFYCPERETTADFLTSVTDPAQRSYRAGFEASAPKTAAEVEQIFRESDEYKEMLGDVKDYETHLEETGHLDAREFKQSVKHQQSRHVSEKSNFTVSYWRQVLSCTRREYWLVLGDLITLKTKFFVIVSNGLIVGSLFYGTPHDTSGVFSKGGLVFLSIVFLGWLQLGELLKAVTGRAVIQRHKEYSFYRPSAVALGRVLADFPMILAMTTPFAIIMYFLGGLQSDVSKFWIFYIFLYTTTFTLTSIYRMFAALSPNVNDALLHQKIWFGWLYYINPLTYAFEGVLSNEFYHQVLPCSAQQLIPQGPGVEPQFQGCAVTGARAGNPSITGDQYLEASFSYSRSHLWRNFGVMIALTILYIVVTLIGCELFSFVGGGGGALVFKKGAKSPAPSTTKAVDPEKAGDSGDSSSSSGVLSEKGLAAGTIPKTTESESVLTWTDVNYSVPYDGGERQLLTEVHGYAKPGVMVALMGVSGAGKTTLLNTLSQRQYFGKVSGNLLMDGRPLGPEYQRMTGYVEQMDMHDSTATIREAIEFSAILRQDRDTPKQEKLTYVEEIIDLLELREIQDALILSLGVEQRKRVTIAVELAAKPSLLFLDEPTTGLDSQSAFTVIRFIQKLARAGHGVICTIHQPSSVLVQQFDMILALNPGGQTFYFGPVGENGAAVNKYFAERGIECPPQKNIAEFILETAAKVSKRKDGKRINWNEEWRNSQEIKDLVVEIEHINNERSKIAPKEASTQHVFASPLWLQCYMLTKRMFIQHWRDPSYLYGKLFVAVLIGIINGFTFWNLGNTLADFQNRMFSTFLIIIMPATVVNGVVPKFYQNMALWQYRENPSRSYNWFAFSFASTITEVPSAIVGSVLYWLLWYLPAGLPRDSSTAGYVFLMTMLFFLFQSSWGQWICAFAPSFTVLSNILPFFFVMFSLFNGVIRPYSQLSVFWKYWMYYINPSTYYIGGVISATLRDQTVNCASNEVARFNPPPGQTCGQYAGSFIDSIGRGYLTNVDATSDCGYCQYKNGVEYMAGLNIKPSDKWHYMPIFLAFVISNWALVYFFIYTVRVKHWGFGVGYISRPVGKVLNLLIVLPISLLHEALNGKKKQDPNT
ncbi:uncharacterized protein KY384_007157 [Bacidia gigantensis]|uniref:uncharacterized protein n=1 Tax=Bacidia gigantensis TaxID=2732470 RepID=UPI001D037DD1|nr:uncharacterized protein KY384_007157 [Bacidia gigantensis]KAG8528240.1 hypothetical protein KY384_007157 [Bacidia gigantensis]